jgi:hypothetical protein
MYVYIHTCALFRRVDCEIELCHYMFPKLFIRKRYYVLFLIPVFIVQVIKLVQFPQYNILSKIPLSTSMHFAARVRTWRVARLYSVQWNSSLSETVRNRTHVHIQFSLLRMADNVTSQNIDVSSWDILCIGKHVIRHLYPFWIGKWHPWPDHLCDTLSMCDSGALYMYRDHLYHLLPADRSLVWLWVCRGRLGMITAETVRRSQRARWIEGARGGRKNGKGYKKGDGNSEKWSNEFYRGCEMIIWEHRVEVLVHWQFELQTESKVCILSWFEVSNYTMNKKFVLCVNMKVQTTNWSASLCPL